MPRVTADRVRALLRAGKTQTEVARLLGVSRQAVHQVATKQNQIKSLRDRNERVRRASGTPATRHKHCTICGEDDHNRATHHLRGGKP